MKVGILGGTFNPPHTGHLVLAQIIKDKLSLDRVIFIPTNYPPHKHTNLVSANKRLIMVRLAVKDNPDLSVLDWEIKRGGISYTVDTLRQLKSHYPKRDFFLIIGSDLADDFYSWKDYIQIDKLAKIVMAKRMDFSFKDKRNFITVDMVGIGITSSLVRQYIKKGLSIRYLVPPAVFNYIIKNKLYICH